MMDREHHALAHGWGDLGWWNYYFLAKFVLLWMGLLNFNALLNLGFAVGLLLPLPGRLLPALRQVIAVPLGIALLYKDSWFPPFRRMLEQGEVLDFTPAYMLELLTRFINWDIVGVLAVLGLFFILVAPWLRLTLVSVAGVCWIFLAGVLPTLVPTVEVRTAVAESVAVASGPADSAVIDAWLDDFYSQQAGQAVVFPDRNATAEPFDLLFLNICSLAWDDLDGAGLRDNALLRSMDVVFDSFNSATSYSGPAAIRVLRAGCGQTPHQALYQEAPQHCLLFENLARLGFSPETLLNFDGPLVPAYQELLMNQGLPAVSFSTGRLQQVLRGYDGSPMARDYDVLQEWWRRRQAAGKEAVSLFYNTITLHDGNLIIAANGTTRRASFQERARTLLDDLHRFVDTLEQSGRRVMLVLIPEHGAALQGDLMQISGMREIPAPSITHVPVGLKLINMDTPALAAPHHVIAPVSHLALAELVLRLYRNQGTAVDWPTLLSDLPTTAVVSENSDARVVEYGGVPYVQVGNQRQWMPYPTRGRR